MTTNATFNEDELTLLLKTVLKARNVIFDAVEIKFDNSSISDKTKYNPSWKGKRGTCPLLEDLERTLALIRLHINKEETIQLYELMGFYDKKSNAP